MRENERRAIVEEISKNVTVKSEEDAINLCQYLKSLPSKSNFVFFYFVDYRTGNDNIIAIDSYRPEINNFTGGKVINSSIIISWPKYEPIEKEISVKVEEIEDTMKLIVDKKMEIFDEPTILKMGAVDLHTKTHYKMRLKTIKAANLLGKDTWKEFEDYRKDKMEKMEAENKRMLALIQA